MDQVYQALSEPSDEELLQAVADLRGWEGMTVAKIKSTSPHELDADDILEVCRSAITASRRYDPRPLPAPWQWLKDAKPEPGQHCEWVELAPCWSGTGQGEWTEIDTSVNPDEQFWSAPGCGRAIIKGFRNEKGIGVYDPTITAWRAMDQDNSDPPKPGQHFRVRFTPRPSHDGRELMPELQKHIGAELLVRPLWQMDDSDPYPGEWAMGNADCHSDLLGRAWIASGDLTIAPPEPTLNLNFASIEPTTLAESGLTFTRATP